MLNSRLRNCFHADVFRNCMRWGLVLAGLALSVAQANAEYRVNVGDVLEVAVAGVPELRSRAAIQVDGNVSLPMIGTLAVAGLTLSEIRAHVGVALASKSFRQRTTDGREVAIVIDADEVTASVAEYRPIYAAGDVSKPGEYPYRPASTARQLIALAGGYDIMHFRMNNPYLDSADLRGEYGTLWAEFAKEEVRIWRIKNQLGEGTQIDPNAMKKDFPIPSSALSEIVNSEKEFLKAQDGDYEREKAYLQHSLREGDNEINVLSMQQKTEDEGYQSDLEELKKISDLFGKGALVSPRVTDARRAVLLSSSRKLQITAQLLQIKKQQDELTRKLEKLDDQRRIDLLRELQECTVKRHEISEKLQSVGEKLQYTAMVRSQLARGSVEKPAIAIIRKGEKGQERFVADEDAELQPGDTVEVTLRYQEGPEAPLRKLSDSNASSVTGRADPTADEPRRILGSR